MKKYLLFGLLSLLVVMSVFAQTKTVTFHAKGLSGSNLNFSVEVWNRDYQNYGSSEQGIVILEIPANIGTLNYSVNSLQSESINQKEIKYVQASGFLEVNKTTSVVIDYSKSKKVVPVITYPAGYAVSNGSIQIGEDHHSSNLYLNELEYADYYMMPGTYTCTLLSYEGLFPMKKAITITETDTNANLAFDLSSYKKLAVQVPDMPYGSLYLRVSKDNEDLFYDFSNSQYYAYLPAGEYIYEARGNLEIDGTDEKTVEYYASETKTITVTTDMTLTLFKDYYKVVLEQENKDIELSDFRLYKGTSDKGEVVVEHSYGKCSAVHVPAGIYYFVGHSPNAKEIKQTLNVSGDKSLKLFEDYYKVTIDASNFSGEDMNIEVTTLPKGDNGNEMFEVLLSVSNADKFYIPAGSYRMNIRANGYLTQTETLNVSGDMTFKPFEDYYTISLIHPYSSIIPDGMVNIIIYDDNAYQPLMEAYLVNEIHLPAGTYRLSANVESFMPDRHTVQVNGDMQLELFKNYTTVGIDNNDCKDDYLRIEFYDTALRENLLMTLDKESKMACMPVGNYYISTRTNRYYPENRMFNVTGKNDKLTLFENYFTVKLNENTLPQGLKVGDTSVYETEEDYIHRPGKEIFNFSGTEFYAPATTCFLYTSIRGITSNIFYIKNTIQITGNMSVDCVLDEDIAKVKFAVKDIDGVTPLEGAQINIEIGENYTSQSTDENGEVSFYLPKGKCLYSVMKENYIPKKGQLDVQTDGQTVDVSFVGYREVILDVAGLGEYAYPSIYLYYGGDDYQSMSFKDNSAVIYVPDGSYRYRLIANGYDEQFGTITIDADHTSFSFDYSAYRHVVFAVNFPNDTFGVDNFYLYVNGEKRSVNFNHNSESEAVSIYLPDGEYSWNYRFHTDNLEGVSSIVPFTVKGEDLWLTSSFNIEDYCEVTATVTNVPNVEGTSLDEYVYYEGSLRMKNGNLVYRFDFDSERHKTSLSDKAYLPKGTYSYETDWYVADDVIFAIERGTIGIQESKAAMTLDMGNWKRYALNVKDAASGEGVPYVSGLISDTQGQTAGVFNNDDEVPINTFYFYAPQAAYEVKTVANGYQSKQTSVAANASSVDILMTKATVYSVFFSVYSAVGYDEDFIEGATVTLEGYGNGIENAYLEAYYINDVPVSDTPVRYTVSKEGYETVTGTVVVNESNFDDDYSGVAVYVGMVPRNTAIEENLLEEVAIRVYPNPTSDYLYIDGLGESGNWKAQVYAADGRMVISTEVADARLDLSALESGIYYIRLFNEERSISMKVMRQ